VIAPFHNGTPAFNPLLQCHPVLLDPSPTCPSEAAATGLSLMDEKICSSGLPSCSSMMANALLSGKGGTSSCDQVHAHINNINNPLDKGWHAPAWHAVAKHSKVQDLRTLSSGGMLAGVQKAPLLSHCCIPPPPPSTPTCSTQSSFM
jgi:hypothetical protein